MNSKRLLKLEDALSFRSLLLPFFFWFDLQAVPKVDSVPDLFQLIRRIEISVVSSDWKRQAGTGELVECSRVSDQRARLSTGHGFDSRCGEGLFAQSHFLVQILFRCSQHAVPCVCMLKSQTLRPMPLVWAPENMAHTGRGV